MNQSKEIQRRVSPSLQGAQKPCPASFDTSQAVVRVMAEVWSNCGGHKEGETCGEGRRARLHWGVDRQEASGMSVFVLFCF